MTLHWEDWRTGTPSEDLEQWVTADGAPINWEYAQPM